MRYIKPDNPQFKIKVDAKDKKIMSLLSKNSRLSATTLSKQVGLSRDGVSYRIKRLEKAGAIQGYKTIVDVNKFGYESYHIFLQLSQPSGEAEKKLITKLNDNKYIRAILKFSGKFDLELAVIAKNTRHFDKILNEILTDCKEHLNNYQILAITKNYVQRTFPKAFYEKDDSEKTLPQKAEKFELDETDEKILKAMTNNASLPLYEIGKQAKVSADTVNYRIKKMMQEGVINKFTIALNYSSLSYDVYAVLLHIPNLSSDKEKKLRQVLLSDNNIIWAVKTIGSYNVLIYVCADKSEKLHDTIIKLRNNFPQDIKDYETMIAYEEYKYTYFPENLDLFKD